MGCHRISSMSSFEDMSIPTEKGRISLFVSQSSMCLVVVLTVLDFRLPKIIVWWVWDGSGLWEEWEGRKSHKPTRKPLFVEKDVLRNTRTGHSSLPHEGSHPCRHLHCGLCPRLGPTQFSSHIISFLITKLYYTLEVPNFPLRICESLSSTKFSLSFRFSSFLFLFFSFCTFFKFSEF